MGTLPKDTTSGPFADDWKRAFAEISKDIEEVDITPALSNAFSIKDPEELVSLVALSDRSRKAVANTFKRFRFGMRPGRVVG